MNQYVLRAGGLTLARQNYFLAFDSFNGQSLPAHPVK